MVVQGYCSACGELREISGQSICELCGGPGRTTSVCRSCKLRREKDRPTLRRILAETGNEHLLPDDDSRGVTIVVDRCERCKAEGDAETENMMTSYTIRDPTMQ